jgi:hypothetical protein
MVIFTCSDSVQQLSEKQFSEENSWNQLNNWEKKSSLHLLEPIKLSFILFILFSIPKIKWNLCISGS